jgi:hypothetical protein
MQADKPEQYPSRRRMDLVRERSEWLGDGDCKGYALAKYFALGGKQASRLSGSGS